MTKIHHLNCGTLHAPPNPQAACHCLLLEDVAGLALVDTGIGLMDCQRPLERIGQTLIDLVGWKFDERVTAIRQITAMGFNPSDVYHIILTHGDPDHAGGLADFPQATVHLSEEEQTNIQGGNRRYLPIQFEHVSTCNRYAGTQTRDWFGLPARPINLGFESEVLLIPLFGHTLGHCGVAIAQGDRWHLHVGDAYYLRVELMTDDHPITAMTIQRADDDAQRRVSLNHLRRLARDHNHEVVMHGYHDFGEFSTS